MKKIIFIVFALLVFPINLFAKAEISLFAGRANVHIESLSAEIIDSLGGRGYSVYDMKGAELIVGTDYLHDIGEKVKAGLRIAYLRVDEKSCCCGIKRKDPQTGKILIVSETKSEYRVSLLPVMIGGSYNKSISEKFRWTNKLFFGCGLVNFESTYPRVVNKAKVEEIEEIYDTKKLNETKCCFVTDLSTGVQYLFTKRFGIGFDVGYRYTPEIEPSKDVKLDFSGVTFALGLSYKI